MPIADRVRKSPGIRASLGVGRSLGFIYRNLLANRAVELAKAEAASASPSEEGSPPEFRDSARYVVLSSIPVDRRPRRVAV